MKTPLPPNCYYHYRYECTHCGYTFVGGSVTKSHTHLQYECAEFKKLGIPLPHLPYQTQTHFLKHRTIKTKKMKVLIDGEWKTRPDFDW